MQFTVHCVNSAIHCSLRPTVTANGHPLLCLCSVDVVSIDKRDAERQMIASQRRAQTAGGLPDL